MNVFFFFFPQRLFYPRFLSRLLLGAAVGRGDAAVQWQGDVLALSSPYNQLLL